MHGTLCDLYYVIPIMIFAIPLAAIVCGTVVVIVRVLMGKSSKRSSELDAQDTELIQEIHKGLLKMEERIDALETIMLDRDRDRTKGNRQ